MHFSARDLLLDYICTVKYGAFFTIARPFLNRRNFFHDFFVLVLFQDEVKQLSNWKFFKRNRFGDRISPPKCILRNFED